jgi:hypothetical protein
MSDFRLEHGKRYVTRDGRVTDGPVWDTRQIGSDDTNDFVGFIGTISYWWNRDGTYGSEHANEPNDLVRKYVEPSPPKWVPFGKDEWPAVCGRPVRRKKWGSWVAATPTLVGEGGAKVDGIFVSWVELLADYTFIDGTPCGKQVPQ